MKAAAAGASWSAPSGELRLCLLQRSLACAPLYDVPACAAHPRGVYDAGVVCGAAMSPGLCCGAAGTAALQMHVNALAPSTAAFVAPRKERSS